MLLSAVVVLEDSEGRERKKSYFIQNGIATLPSIDP
jgi:hypothetical protein